MLAPRTDGIVSLYSLPGCGTPLRTFSINYTVASTLPRAASLLKSTCFDLSAPVAIDDNFGHNLPRERFQRESLVLSSSITAEPPLLSLKQSVLSWTSGGCRDERESKEEDARPTVMSRPKSSLPTFIFYSGSYLYSVGPY